MAKDKKRKREDHGEDEADVPSSKAQIVESEGKPSKSAKSEKPGGDRRQKRSERKKKRDVAAKQNAKTKRDEALTRSSTDGIPVQDALSSGQDFVPLTSDGFQKFKEKRRSPRSIRKEAREKKRIEQGLDPHPIDPDNMSKKAKKLIKKAEKKARVKEGANAAAEARFICFVGNLPFTVTNEQLEAHFSKLQPKAVRISTDKKTGQGKGFAFLEFDSFDKMKTCLKLYHHSIFDPDKIGDEEADNQNSNQAAKPKGRKINVELTAGGGGSKSAGRKDKIVAKNKKLNEERARDWEKKKQDETKSGKGSKAEAGGPHLSDANAQQIRHDDDNRGAIHPSRMSRVRG